MSSEPSPSPPDAGSLYQAALHYLARYASTEAGLRRVLVRRVDRWARAQTDPDAIEPVVAAARATVNDVVVRLVKAGAVSDTVFAESRARGLVRGGQSSRAIQARLIGKGVDPGVARAASVTDPDSELAAALILARKRRIGPYRTDENPDTTARTKELGRLAQAGFSRDIAERALETSREDAERRIFELRQG